MWRYLWSAFGMALMYYEWVEDVALAHAESAGDLDYSPTCDMELGFGRFTREVSCSTILKSEYAKGFGFLDKVQTPSLKKL